IEPLAQGRVWLGAQGKTNGLVDELGGIDRAVDLIRDKAKIPTSEKVTLVTYPPKRTIFDLILNRSDESVETLITRRAQLLVKHMPIRALMHGGILSMMPYTIEVR